MTFVLDYWTLLLCNLWCEKVQHVPRTQTIDRMTDTGPSRGQKHDEITDHGEGWNIRTNVFDMMNNYITLISLLVA